MAARFWHRWSLAVSLLITVFVVFLTPFSKLCQCSCQHMDQACQCNGKQQKTLHVRDIIIYNTSELLNLTGKIVKVRKQREYDSLLKEEFLEQIAQERELREEIESLKSAIKMGLSNAARLRHSGWVVDCVTWERKREIHLSDIQPRNFTIDHPLIHDMEPDGRRKDTFIQIFEKRDWPADDPSYPGLKASGPGAMLRNAQGIIAAVHSVLNKLKDNLGKSTITLLDVPCGDFQWMSRFLLTRNDVLYTGADIVPELIQHHRKTFADLPRTEFIEWDIVKTPINRSFDLIVTRDMLQHLYKGDAMQALLHISESKSQYLLATTFPSTSQNTEDLDRTALGSRKVSYNLELAPFLLDSPICSSYDWNVEHIALWSLPLKQKRIK